MDDVTSMADSPGGTHAVGHNNARRTWGHWLCLILSFPVLALCALLPIARGERVYRFLLEFREKYTELDWTMVVACRWIAWLTLIVAVVQVGVLVALVARPRRRTLIASYVGIAVLAALFLIWAYFMAPSASLEDALRKPS